MLNKLRVRVQEEKGFTLVELLVVMLILGLLAAIAIPAFFNQRDKAKDSDAKAGARTAQTAIETWATDNDGAYTGVVAAGTELKTIEQTLNDYDLAVSYPSGAAYRVAVTSDTDTEFSIQRATGGTTVYTCDDPGAGGCPESGSWAGTEPPVVP